MRSFTYNADIKWIMKVENIVLFIKKEIANIHASMKENINILSLY